MSDEFVEKNNSNGLIIIIVILILAVLGLGGYIFYDNYFKNDKDDVKVVKRIEEEEPSRELSASEVEEYIEKIEIYNRYLYQYFLLNEKDEISNSEALFFAYKVLMTDDKDVTAENVSDVLEKYFGKSHEFILDDIKCLICSDKILFTYDSENNIYVEARHDEHEDEKLVASHMKYISSQVKKDKVNLITKNLYEIKCNDECESSNLYYSDINDIFNGENHVLGDPKKDEELPFTDELFDSVKDKLPNVVYNFIIEESGNFYLESVSIEN